MNTFVGNDHAPRSVDRGARCDCRLYQTEGECWHTGKQTGDLPRKAYRIERDREYEVQFLRDVEELAVQLNVPPDGVYRRLVFYRTDGAGASNYGDTSFLTDDRDLLREAREEAGDGGVYPMFYAERHQLKPGDEKYHHLAAACAHFAAGDFYLRLAQQPDD